ncbi:ATP-dependent helicase [Sphingomicrobium flavum]|uniref:ATP-dependent helicase n=1 Tax=Sphingomicrobium flavum TaxID=1229164 RepID=UPI0021AD790F|nr:UvrD-helicase domain-containing protein [Sphingomicrobium flavum]
MTESAPPPASEAPWLAGLNPPQREAVLTTEGPVLMLAGAGTGKTRALTARLANLIATRKAWPSQILAVTFTNKAAREMKERISDITGGAVEGMPYLGTFHAVCARMLRSHAELVGLRSNFTIIDTDDQLRLLKQLIQAASIDDKRFPARLLASLIDGWKNKGLTPAQLSAADAEAYANGKGQDLYAQYQARLAQVNAADFGDLLLHMLTIFKSHPDVLESYRDRFRYILVDEYQDTNASQYEWLRLLASPRNNICCVGDDDQSIYSWRGAEVANILRFEKDFPDAKIIRLEQNYRSTGHILKAAGGVIAHNSGRLGKELWTDAGDGEKVQVIGVWDGPEEARRVAEEIENHLSKGGSLNDCAILVRAQHQTREFEDRFIAIGMDYQIIGGFRFYERAEIRDAIAYLRLVHQPADDLAFDRIVNQPKRGLGDKAMQTIHRFARALGEPLLFSSAQILDSDELRPAARNALARFIADVSRWRGLHQSSLSRSDGEGDHRESDGGGVMDHAQLARTILDESGYTAMLQADKSPEAAGRLDNLSELVRAMEEYDSLEEFLEHVSLVMDNDRDPGGARVTIMTIHAAKGLEFPLVFLAGWEEGLFPSQRALDEGGIASLEEERRLAYVAITRARQRATILHAANRRIYGQWTSSIPSRFVEELPEEHVEEETTLSGGASLWRAQWTAHDDPFAHVAKPGTRGPGFQRAMASSPSPLAGEGGPHRFGGGRERGPASRADRIRTAKGPVEARGSAVSLGNKGRGDLAVGQRVFHDKFGYGVIEAIEGNKLEVEFEKAGKKRVLDSFVS